MKSQQTRSSFRTLLVVCAAHFISHLHLMLLPPVFALMSVHYGVSFVDLGVALTVFNVSSTLTQPTVGRLCDRYGPQRTLIAGLLLGGLSFILVGMTSSYAALLVLMAAAGLANSVYHPADYAILSRLISVENKGKAFSIHTFSGFIGGAAAPLGMNLAISYWSWQAGVIAGGILALVVAAMIPLIPNADRTSPEPSAANPKAAGSAAQSVKINGEIAKLTLFFFIMTLSTTGINNFAISAFTVTSTMDIVEANLVLTFFLVSMSIGVLAGGFLADRFSHHERIAALGFALAGVLVALVAVTDMSVSALYAVFTVSGFLVGMVMPSRDMMVNRAATPATTGQVFGIVTTGLNAGGMVAPPIFGYLLDKGWPAGIFAVSALFMLITGVMAIMHRSRG
jgi:MFS family permease